MMASTRQQDFETLEYTGSAVPVETAHTSLYAPKETSQAVCDGDGQSEMMQFSYNGIDEQTLLQAISEAPYHQSLQPVSLEEPRRRLRPFNGPAAKPKRFFSTFWRGLSKRALSVENLNSSMNE